MDDATYRKLGEHAPALLAVFDTNGQFRWANAAWQRTLGHEASALIGTEWTRLVHPDDMEGTRASIVAPAPDAGARHRARFRHASSGWRWIDWFCGPVQSDGLFYGRDLTTQMAEEAAARRQRELLNLADDIAGVGHWSVDVASGRIDWSPHVFQIYGRDPAAGRPSLEEAVAAYHVDDRARVSALVSNAVEQGEAFTFELRIVRPSGEIRHVVSHGRCETDPASGQTTTLFGTFLDVTDRERARERELRAARFVTVGTLSAGLGHELNNPLTYVAANVAAVSEELDALAGASPSGRWRALQLQLDEVRAGVASVIKTVRGLRAFVRDDVAPVATSIDRALQLALKSAHHELAARASCHIEIDDVPDVLADESLLAQVIVNVLVNAVQAFPAADPKSNMIAVRARRAGETHVELTITDNASGILPELLPRIFDPFFTTKPVGEGSGLGLAVAQSIVHRFGGEITVSSGRTGTAFAIRLCTAAPSSAPERASPMTRDGPRIRLAIVDDEPALLTSLGNYLGREFAVNTFADPREAVSYLSAENAADVVLCDIMMPHLSGKAVFEAVVAHSPGLADRFVFMSGGVTRDELRSFIASLPNVLLDKPFEMAELATVIRQAQSRAALAAG